METLLLGTLGYVGNNMNKGETKKIGSKKNSKKTKKKT